MTIFASTPPIKPENPGVYGPPRSEFDGPRAHEANPILVIFREARVGRPNVTTSSHAGAFLASLRHMVVAMGLSNDVFDHAHRVLSRLAVFA